MTEFDEMSTDELWAALPEIEGAEKGRLLMHLMSRNGANHEHGAAVSLAQQAAEVFISEGLDREYANAKAFEGDGHMRLGEHEEAHKCYQEAINHLDEVLNLESIAAINMSLGENEEARHNQIVGLMYFIAAVDMYSREDNWDDAARAQSKVMKIIFEYGKPDEQLIQAQKYYDLAKKADNSHALMQALTGIAFTYDSNDDFEYAIKTAKDALVLAHACTCDRCVPDTQESLGIIYLNADRIDKAQKFLKLAIKNFRKAGYSRSATYSRAFLGKTYLKRDPKKAKKIFKDILTLTGHVDNDRARFVAGRGLADYYTQHEQKTKAISLYEELIPLAESKFNRTASSHFKLMLCNLLLENDQYDRVREILPTIDRIIAGNARKEAHFAALNLIVNFPNQSPDEIEKTVQEFVNNPLVDGCNLALATIYKYAAKLLNSDMAEKAEHYELLEIKFQSML